MFGVSDLGVCGCCVCRCGFSDLGCVGFRFFAFGGGSDDNVWGFSNLGCGFYGGGPVLCLEVVYGFCDWRWL